jgi:hypothetical protein
VRGDADRHALSVNDSQFEAEYRSCPREVIVTFRYGVSPSP